MGIPIPMGMGMGMGKLGKKVVPAGHYFSPLKIEMSKSRERFASLKII